MLCFLRGRNSYKNPMSEQGWRNAAERSLEAMYQRALRAEAEVERLRAELDRVESRPAAAIGSQPGNEKEGTENEPVE